MSDAAESDAKSSRELCGVGPGTLLASAVTIAVLGGVLPDWKDSSAGPVRQLPIGGMVIRTLTVSSPKAASATKAEKEPKPRKACGSRA